MSQDMFENRPAVLRRSGQSMLEMAMFLPILLLLIAGMVEVGAYANDYLTLLNAGREGARFGVDLDPSLTVKSPFDARDGASDPFPDVRSLTSAQLYDVCANGKTVNFYYEIACLTFQNIPSGTLKPENGDDIVVTVIGVQDGQIAHRWPISSQAHQDDWGYHFPGADDGAVNASCTITHTENCRGWSLYGERTSTIDNDTITDRLDSSDPDTGLVIVEIFYAHPHFVGVFAIGDFIPDPIQTHTYAIFPLSAATPK